MASSHALILMSNIARPLLQVWMLHISHRLGADIKSHCFCEEKSALRRNEMDWL